MSEIEILRKLPTLEVNERLAGKALLTFEYDGQIVEVELSARYARLLIVVKKAHDEDLKGDRNESRRGYRSRERINKELTRLPGNWNRTVDGEVTGKIYGIRRLLENALLAHDLKPSGRNYFFESLNGWGYRFGVGLAELEIVGLPPDPSSQTAEQLEQPE